MMYVMNAAEGWSGFVPNSGESWTVWQLPDGECLTVEHEAGVAYIDGPNGRRDVAFGDVNVVGEQ